MNAIMGFSDLLVSNFENKNKLQKFSNIIRQRCSDLLDIINDILDIAKIESGQLPVNSEECDLKELFIELSTFFIEYQNRIGKQHIEFSLHAFNDPNYNMIFTDKVKLKQIFINLISNAFKFTNTGSIKGGCKIDENNQAVFYISDTGVGIPLDRHTVIYVRFAHLQNGLEMNIGGTGLGLPIVKGLVSLLGGEIFLESEPEKGSTFSFSFPFKTVQRLQQKQANNGLSNFNNLINKNILIVEDDLYNAEYLKEILTNCGINIVHTIYGNEAVKISLTQPIDLVLMDIRLPDLNGYEATIKIKQSKPQIKVIAQTAYAATDEKQKAIDSGCINYISKPTNRDLLLTLISKHLSVEIKK
jgi:CheY-like chemotaxis protein